MFNSINNKDKTNSTATVSYNLGSCPSVNSAAATDVRLEMIMKLFKCPSFGPILEDRDVLGLRI